MLKLTYCVNDTIMFVIIDLFLFGDIWLVLTFFVPVFYFDPPENIGFLMFSGGSKGEFGKKSVNWHIY